MPVLKRIRISAAFWVTAAPLLLFILPLVNGKVIYWGLPALQFIPWRHYAWQLIRQGTFPLWNPLNGLGAPLLANYQLALFYPPALPLFLLDEIWGAAGLAWGLTLLVPLHLAWGALGMVRFLRLLGIRQRGQIVAGLAFGLGGYLVARDSFFSIIWAAAWLPWILAGVEAFLQAPDARGKWIAGLKVSLYGTMLLLAGHAQVAWYALLFAGLWTVVRAWQRGRLRFGLRAGSILVACILFAVVLSAVQLFPTYEYLTQSQRASAYAYETAVVYSFSPLRLLGFLIPDLFGNPGYGDFYGYATYWEDAVYIGLVPFVLALTSLAWLVKKRSPSDPLWPAVVLLWLVVVTGTVLALGSNTPVFPWLYRNVPTFSMFQAPARWMLWPVTALAILAGISAERWAQPQKKGRMALNLAVVGGLVLAVVGWLASLALPQAEPGLVRGIMLLGAGIAISAFIARRVPTPGPVGVWGIIAGVWLTVDLLVASAALTPAIPASTFNIAHSQIEQINKMRNGGRIWIDPQVEYQIKFNTFFVFDDFQHPIDRAALRQSLLPNLNLLDGLPLVNNFDPLLPARFAAWQEQLEGMDAVLAQKWLTLAGAGAELVIDPQTLQAGLNPLPAGERTGWAGCAIPAATAEEAFQAVSQRLLRGADSACVVLEGGVIPSSSPAEGSSSVEILAERPNQILLNVAAPSDGWVVLRDSRYPGWQAQVDGQPAAVLHADYLFRAVPVPAGSHQIALEYRPAAFTMGVWISVIGWILFAALWYFHRRNVK